MMIPKEVMSMTSTTYTLELNENERCQFFNLGCRAGFWEDHVWFGRFAGNARRCRQESKKVLARAFSQISKLTRFHACVLSQSVKAKAFSSVNFAK